MIVFDTVTRLPASITNSDLRRIGVAMGRALRLRSKRHVGLAFVDEKEIQRLNKNFRGKNKPTDVLSFEPEKGSEKEYLGDIAVCPAYAKREAARRSLPWREELVRLVVHGVLHLSGYDHATEDEEAEMFALQERLVGGMMNL